MILSDGTLLERLSEFVVQNADPKLVNPASIDVRIGLTAVVEIGDGKWKDIDLSQFSINNPYLIRPGEFMLISTFENIEVPNGYIIELKLKSSRAREGYNHSLAFHIDPGWKGILTMEVSNVTRYTRLPIYPGLRFGQMIIHQTDKLSTNPYVGKYMNASTVERSKTLIATT